MIFFVYLIKRKSFKRSTGMFVLSTLHWWKSPAFCGVWTFLHKPRWGRVSFSDWFLRSDCGKSVPRENSAIYYRRSCSNELCLTHLWHGTSENIFVIFLRNVLLVVVRLQYQFYLFDYTLLTVNFAQKLESKRKVFVKSFFWGRVRYFPKSKPDPEFQALIQVGSGRILAWNFYLTWLRDSGREEFHERICYHFSGTNTHFVLHL